MGGWGQMPWKHPCGPRILAHFHVPGIDEPSWETPGVSRHSSGLQRPWPRAPYLSDMCTHQVTSSQGKPTTFCSDIPANSSGRVASEDPWPLHLFPAALPCVTTTPSLDPLLGPYPLPAHLGQPLHMDFSAHADLPASAPHPLTPHSLKGALSCSPHCLGSIFSFTLCPGPHSCSTSPESVPTISVLSHDQRQAPRGALKSAMGPCHTQQMPMQHECRAGAGAVPSTQLVLQKEVLSCWVGFPEEVSAELERRDMFTMLSEGMLSVHTRRGRLESNPDLMNSGPGDK